MAEHSPHPGNGPQCLRARRLGTDTHHEAVVHAQAAGELAYALACAAAHPAIFSIEDA
jgi:hypothetical protein